MAARIGAGLDRAVLLYHGEGGGRGPDHGALVLSLVLTAQVAAVSPGQTMLRCRFGMGAHSPGGMTRSDIEGWKNRAVALSTKQRSWR